MASHPPYSVVLTYNEDLQQLVVHTIDPKNWPRWWLGEWAW
ncbi:hypothetical protein P3T22_005533 [Paraburkholderia sp. GAS348]